MLKNRILPIFAVAALVGVAACENEPEQDLDSEFETTEVITEQDTAMVPVVTPVVTTDTAIVERDVDVDVDVDTVNPID